MSKENNITFTDISRRSFIKGTGAAVGAGAVCAFADVPLSFAGNKESSYLLNRPENTLYSVCLQCNTGCGIKVKVEDGKAVKIDGNPYNPFNMLPPLKSDISLGQAATVDAAICPKGQAGIQTAYDPYRLKKVLKRAGKRGEGKWVTIPFDQAISEIVNGGKLFSSIKGEEDRVIEGMKDLYVLKDPVIAKALSSDIKKIWESKDKKAAVEAFKVKHKDNLKYLIDPNHPDLGIKNNQVVYQWGRKKGGRSEFFKRFFNDYFGSNNGHGHTTVCQGSLYFGCKALSEQYQYNKFDGGKKFYFQADLENAKYVLFVGSNLFDGNYGPTNRSLRLANRLVDKEIEIAVADPRFSKVASKAQTYLPINPGTDAAFFAAIIRYLIEKDKIDKKFLSNANKVSAKADGEVVWTNASLLVKIDKDGTPGALLRAEEIGLAQPETINVSGKDVSLHYLVTMVKGVPTAVDYNNDKSDKPVTGDLFTDTELKGTDGKKIRVKSGLTLVKDHAFSKSINEWCKIAGLDPKEVTKVADKLAAAGKQGCVDIHRGVAQHTNGFHSVVSAMTVNMLLGNFSHKGGMTALSTYDFKGGKSEGTFSYSKASSDKITNCGISIIRHNVKYEDTTLFQGYPAKRNWWPLASDVYQEVIPSAGDAYPYPVKILFTYMGAPNYALPAAGTNTAILADLNKIPLYVTSDIIAGGPTTVYADYIFPDLSYLERWEFHGSHPNMPVKVQPIRQPVIAPLTETVTVYGEKMPCSFEAVLMAMAEKLKMAGFGKDGLGKGIDFMCPDDLYIRFCLNVALDGKPVPNASDSDVNIFIKSRAHLPSTVFDVKRWKAIAGDNWNKLVYVLSRGGRFQDYSEVFPGEILGNPYKSSLNMYQEKTALTKNAFTGKPNAGYAVYTPVSDALGRSPKKAGLTEGYDLHMITQKDAVMTKSRTVVDYWLLELYPENHLIMNTLDAKKGGLKDGDKVKISSATNMEGRWDLKTGSVKPIIGTLKVNETIKPGVVTFAIGYGQWASGSSDIMIDGNKLKGDPRRGVGFNANDVMWIDPHLKNTCMIDPIGGSVSFYDTMIKVEKI